MSGNAATYKSLIERFRAFATGHYNLGSDRFTHGQIDLADLTKFGKYPIMHVVPAGMGVGQRVVIFSFEVFFLEKPPLEENKMELQAEALNDTAEIACDLIAAINPGVLFGDMVSVNLDSTATPLIQEFSNVLTGWQLSLSIEVPKALNACDIPGSFTFIDPSTGTTGNAGQLLGFGKIAVSGQSTVEAEVANDTVTFVGAGGMTITTNPAGDIITFTSEEGGGGDGDVVGPASSVDARLALFDGATGKLLKQSVLHDYDLAQQTVVEDLISTEQSARATADGAILQSLDDEIAARGAADVALQTSINSEATTRGNADAALQTNINTEATTRATADTALQGNIDTEEAARVAADTALQAEIDAEEAARASADAAIQAAIDTIHAKTMSKVSLGF